MNVDTKVLIAVFTTHWTNNYFYECNSLMYEIKKKMGTPIFLRTC
jgi:hypothetical protein